MINAQEFTVGTDPQPAESALRLRRTPASNSVTLRFVAVAGRRYTIESRDTLATAGGTKLTDIESAPANRLIERIEASPGAQRFYRLVTPKQQ